jgi:hypothetical protein
VQTEHNILSAAQGETATVVPSAGTSGRPESFAVTPIFKNSSSSTVPSPSPTSEPSSSPGPILQAQGLVPRDISGAIGAPSLLLWDLRAEGKLWRKENGGPWEAYADRQFLVAPVTVSTGEGTQIAISVEAIHGRMLYMRFHDGQWDDWQELDFPAQFRRRPAVISRAQGKVDVFNVDFDAKLWIISYDGSAWSQWTELGDGINGDVAATTWAEDRIDVFAKYGDITNAPVRHKHWTAESGWAGEWEDLGIPYSSGWDSGAGPGASISSPLVASWCTPEGGCAIDVVINAGSSSHKTFQNGEWSDWIGMLASHEGLEFPDTQSIVRGDGVDGRPFAHLISRGTNTCIHYNAHNGTNWGSWVYIRCDRRKDGDETDYPTEFLPTFVASRDGNVEVMARDLDGNFLKYSFLGMPSPREEGDGNWENLGQPQ